LVLALPLAADEVVESRRLQQEALTAQKAKNVALFLRSIRAASDLRPQHPTLLMQLAIALTANGQHQSAVAVLDRVASMGFVYDLGEEELRPLREVSDFARVAKRFADNALAIGSAREEATIDRLGLIPEGMAYDARRRRLFVSSVRTRMIFVIDAKGGVRPFAEDLPFGVFGMAVDAKRGVLWVTTTALAQTEGFRADQKGSAALLRVDLDSGRVLATLRASDDAAHHFGDVTVAPDGEVYVSDSSAPVIHRVNGDALEPFVRGAFLSLQGLAAMGPLLYVADYAKGIFVIDRRTGDVRAVPVPQNASTLGVDGLYVVDRRTLVATQNGTQPNRIILMRLARGGLAISSVETLLANHALMTDPTLGAVVGSRFFFNARAQWDLFGEDGRIADPLKLLPATVLSVPLR
jgi:hypothetical protein